MCGKCGVTVRWTFAVFGRIRFPWVLPRAFESGPFGAFFCCGVVFGIWHGVLVEAQKESPSAERTPATGSFGYLVIRRCGYPQHWDELSIVGGLISRARNRPKKNFHEEREGREEGQGESFRGGGLLVWKGKRKRGEGEGWIEGGSRGGTSCFAHASPFPMASGWLLVCCMADMADCRLLTAAIWLIRMGGHSTAGGGRSSRVLPGTAALHHGTHYSE